MRFKVAKPADIWVGSIFFVAWVRSAIDALGLGLESFPYKYQIFQFFPFGVIKNLFGLGQKVPGSKAGRTLNS